MNILYIWHAAVEKEYRKLLWKMAEKGHRVSLVTAHRWTESSRDQYFQRESGDDGIAVYPFFVVFRNHIRSFFFLNMFRMVGLLRKIQPEVIYLKEEPYSFAAFQWVWLASFFSPSSVIVIESDENLPVRHPFVYRWIERYVLKRIGGLASVPTAGLSLYQQKGFSGKQFKTSYFVDMDIFKPLPIEEGRKVFPEIREGLLSIGYVGRVTPEKGLDTVIEALAQLAKEGYNAQLYVLGRMAEVYREELESLLDSLAVRDKVVFLEARPMHALVFFYNTIDVVVLPSKTTSWWMEQFGRVIVEAQACGTPVIGSSSGEIPLVIGDEGLVFPESRADKLAEILKRFCTKEYTKEKYKERLLSQVRERFSLAKVAENKLTIMQEVKKYWEEKAK